MGSIPGSGRSPGGGNGDLLQYCCLEKSHGQRSLVDCSPWGCRVGHDWVTEHIITCSVQFSCSVVSDSLRPHEPQHTRPPCLSPTPGVHPNSCPLSWWCHPTISSSVVLFASCLSQHQGLFKWVSSLHLTLPLYLTNFTSKESIFPSDRAHWI